MDNRFEKIRYKFDEQEKEYIKFLKDYLSNKKTN